MDVYLDDQAIAPTAQANTVAQVIEQARASMDPDRVVISILCDGYDVTGDDLTTALQQPADHYARIDLQTGPAHVLIREALEQALVVLEETDGTRQNVVEWLTQGDTKQASDGLAQCFRHWGQIHSAIVQSISMLPARFDDMQVEGQPIETGLAGIVAQLQQIKEALRVGDPVVLSDLLEYEFGQATGCWKATIHTILQHLEQTPANSSVAGD